MIDFNLNPGAPILNRDVELILQQIDMLFDTKPKEVFGDEKFGSKYDEYLYRLKISNTTLEQLVKSDISSLNLFGFFVDVHVSFLHGTEKDIALIEIELNRDEESYQQIYKIS